MVFDGSISIHKNLLKHKSQDNISHYEILPTCQHEANVRSNRWFSGLCRAEGLVAGRQLWFCEVRWNNCTQSRINPEAGPKEWKQRCDKLDRDDKCLPRGWWLQSGRFFLNRGNFISLKFLVIFSSEHLQVLPVPQGDWLPAQSSWA